MSRQHARNATTALETVGRIDVLEAAPVGFEAQVGALPVRGKPGTYEVLMITSRDTGRWVIPKGWPMKGKKDYEAAAREAFEEAGVRGKIHKFPMGGYAYDKRLGQETRSVQVMVYLLEVREVKTSWPEKGERKRKWMSPHDAVALVEENGLANILDRLNSWPDARTARAGS